MHRELTEAGKQQAAARMQLEDERVAITRERDEARAAVAREHEGVAQLAGKLTAELALVSRPRI